MRVRAYGLHATMIDELPPTSAVVLREVFLASCRERGLSCIDAIPAAHSLVITHDIELRDEIRAVANTIIANFAEVNIGAQEANSKVTEIPVRYDGDDLADVAERCSLSIDQVIALHGSVVFSVEFCGFSPGFSYLRGLPPQLHLPRRNSPRPRVPAGSVAIAAHYAAVYPSESPGGWHLLGTTNSRMWDITRDPPALLQPGQRVRFVREDV
jgi:KipI family sensor histidine kinase inhibitor